MKNGFISTLLVTAYISTMLSCKKDDAPPPVIPPSDGKQQQLDGGDGGSFAANSVYIDMSTDNANAVARASWDLKFFNGDQFRVKINNTNGSSAVVVDKTDLNSVGLSDFNKEDTLVLGEATSAALIDNPVTYGVTETVIAEVAATEAANKVYIVNPAGGSHSTNFYDENKLWKIRILRKGTGYTLQYAKLNDATFKTLDIVKDANYNYQFVSLTGGALVKVEPAKTEWDIQWTWSVYYTNMGGGNVPYTFSDLVFINSLGGAQAAEVLTTTTTYDAYSEANIATTTFSSAYDAIGSKWRATTGTVGVKTDRFYVVKDAAGNVYKLKFVSFITNDGGVRGKPVIEYKLVKKA